MNKEIYTTKDYDLFRKLIGNRDVDIKRIQKIKKSILEIGYVTSPILVNEKMEIIDGQGRFYALKELGMPIDYIVEEGLGYKECVGMNVYQTNWTAYDYIISYATRGYKSYEYFLQLQRDYPLITSLEVIAIALLGKSKLGSEEIKSCSLVVTEKQFIEAKEKLEKIYPLILKYRSKKRVLAIMRGVLYCYNIPDVDMDKLLEKVEEILSMDAVPPISTLATVMQYLEELYNKNRRGDYIYIFTEYRKQAEERSTKHNFKNDKNEKKKKK